MCYIVVINRGEKEIGTPREFEEYFGFLPDVDLHYGDLEMDCCLCQCDIDKTFKERGIAFKKDCGDWYVGQLDQITGD